VSARKQAIVAFLAAVLLVVALVMPVLWALAWQQREEAKAREAKAARAESARNSAGEQKEDAKIEAARAGNSSAPPHVYGGLPDSRNYGHSITVLTNFGYLTGYCEDRKNPAWVGFTLGSITAGPAVKRLSTFITDTRTRSMVVHQDYSNSGYDRAHMAPNYAIATRYGPEAQRETFLMSNIIPQSPDLNRVWWRLLEEKEANDFSVRLERVWVMTGPVFNERPKKLPAGVEIPTACYRIMLDEEKGQPRVLAFLVPQTVTGHEPLSQFLISVREVELATHLDFFPDLPREAQDRIETVKSDRLW
jgi:endonuclease G